MSSRPCRAYTSRWSGWTQHSGGDSKTFATAEAQAVVPLIHLRDAVFTDLSVFDTRAV
jgi:hypothetical protein